VRICGSFACASSARRRYWLLTLAMASLWSCNEPYSSHPRVVTPESLSPASSSSGLDALFAPNVADGGPPSRSSYRAMTITRCLSSPTPCLPALGEASLSTSYLVVVGSGHGAVRSRGQATADLYTEMRNRTTNGNRLDAEVQARVDGGASAPVASGSGAPKNASGGDPLAECAQELLDFVDGAGEVTLDVLHESGSNGCLVSMGRLAADGGASRCLVQEPEHPKGPSRQKGIAF
jgi:hypothetical protein